MAGWRRPARRPLAPTLFRVCHGSLRPAARRLRWRLAKLSQAVFLLTLLLAPGTQGRAAGCVAIGGRAGLLASTTACTSLRYRAIQPWRRLRSQDRSRRSFVRAHSMAQHDDAAPSGDEGQQTHQTPPPRPPQQTSTRWDGAPPGLSEASLILEEPDEGVWSEERLEYSGLLADPNTPLVLRGYLCSFKLPSGSGCHAFVGDGQRLSSSVLSGLNDGERMTLVLDVLDAVNHLHSRGSAHLDLQSDRVLARRLPDGSVRAVLIGLGAAVRLQAAPGRSAFQLSSAVAFRAPETIGGALIESNLRALFLMDAWSVGVLIAMIVSGQPTSPFETSPDWSKGEFAQETAVIRKIRQTFAHFSSFLQSLDAGGNGFLFRHGWLIKVLLGLLTVDPKKRLTAHGAWLIAQSGAPGAVGSKAESVAESKRDSRSQERPHWRRHALFRVVLDALLGAEESHKAPPAEILNTPRIAEGLEFDRFRKLQPTGRHNEPFRSLEAMVNIAQRGRASVVMEQRNWTGVKNYGEVVGFRNRADADRWDVFAPGVDQELPIGVPLRLEGLLGVLLVKGGNHKLAVQLAPPYAPVSRNEINADVRAFIDAYSREHPTTSASRIKYLELTADADVASKEGTNDIGMDTVSKAASEVQVE